MKFVAATEEVKPVDNPDEDGREFRIFSLVTCRLEKR